MFVLGILLARFGVRLPGWSVPVGCLLLAVPSDAIEGLGGALIISAAIGPGRFASVLRFAAFRWLGRVSYSLYLVHVPVIYALGPPLTLSRGLSAIMLSCFAAEVMYRLVEVPGIVLGRRVAAFIEARLRAGRIPVDGPCG
jgi:peptidoglycan/LPS O-acetylase OafA/YrhL